MYDLLQKRDLAMKKYQTVLAGNANTGAADQASHYIKEAYRAGEGTGRESQRLISFANIDHDSGYGMLRWGRPPRLSRQAQQGTSGKLAFRMGPFGSRTAPVELLDWTAEGGCPCLSRNAVLARDVLCS